MPDLEFGLNIETTVAGPMPPDRAAIESQVANQFAVSGRLGELQGKRGGDTFDAAVNERYNAQMAAYQASIATPATPTPEASADPAGYFRNLYEQGTQARIAAQQASVAAQAAAEAQSPFAVPQGYGALYNASAAMVHVPGQYAQSWGATPLPPSNEWGLVPYQHPLNSARLRIDTAASKAGSGFYAHDFRREQSEEYLPGQEEEDYSQYGALYNEATTLQRIPNYSSPLYDDDSALIYKGGLYSQANRSAYDEPEQQWMVPYSAREVFGPPNPNGMQRFGMWRAARGQQMRASLGTRGGQFALGYSIMQLGQEAGATYAADATDQYITPEQDEKNNLGILPGVGGVVGALAGAAFGDPIIGGFIGSGIGSATSQMIAPGLQKEQDTRQTAEMINTSAGGAASNVNTLIDALNNLSAPIGVIKDAVGSIANTVGPLNLSPGALNGGAAMVNALGEYAQGDYATVSKQLRDPALYPLAQEMRSNLRLSVGSYGSLAASAIVNNDPAALLSDQRDMAAAQISGNADYNGYTSGLAHAHDISSIFLPSPFKGGGAAAGVGNFFFDAASLPSWGAQATTHAIAGWWDSAHAGNIERGQGVTPASLNAVSINLWNNRMRTAQFNETGDASGAALSGSFLQSVSLSGGNLGAMTTGAHGFEDALAKAASDQDAESAVLQRMLNDKQFAGDRAELQDKLNASRAKAQAYRNQSLAAGKDLFAFGVDAHNSDFARTQLEGELGGASAASQSGAVAGQALYLTTTALNPHSPLSPSERNQMRMQAEQMVYQNQMHGFSQTLGQNAANTAAAGIGVAQAQAFGSPSDVFGAQTQVLAEFKDRIKELTDQLKSGNLTLDDRIAKEHELNTTRAQSISFGAQIQQDKLNADLGIANTTYAGDIVGLSRDIRTGGNQAVPGAAFGDADSAISAARAKLANAQTPQEVADAKLSLANATAQKNSLLDASNTFAMTGAETRSIMADTGAFQRSMLAPYMDGPDSNPLMRGNALLGDYNTELSGLTANRAAKMKSGAWRDTDETTFTGQQQELLGQIAGLKHDQMFALFNAVPEMMIGDPGGGAGVSARPFGAMSSFFGGSDGYNPTAGSWGRAPASMTTHTGPGESAQVGGEAGAFSDAATKQIVAAIDRLTATVKSGAAPAAHNPVSQVVGRAIHNSQGIR